MAGDDDHDDQAAGHAEVGGSGADKPQTEAVTGQEADKKPRLVGSRPSPKPQPGRISAAQYERLWMFYRDGVRTASELGRSGGVSRETARRAISRGWPDRQFAPLAERARLIDRQQAAKEADLAAEKFRQETDEFYRARRRNLQLLEGATALAVGSLRRIHDALQQATWTRYRRVTKVVDGHQVTADEPYVPGREVVQSMRAAASAIRDLGAYERKWLEAGQGRAGAGGDAGKGEDQAAPPPQMVTEEQFEYMREHGGQLPPDVTDESVDATIKFMLAQRVPQK